MKKFLLFTFLNFVFISYSQSIKENKTDEFTKSKVISTDWEVLNREFSCGCASFYRFRKVNENISFEFKYMDSKVLSVHKDFDFMFKLSNDSIISIKTNEGFVGCRGCGAIGFSGSEAWGINVVYPIDKDILEDLLSSPLTKIRFYTTSGFINLDVKEKKAKTFIDALKLFMDTK
jgi:hypothetical protein